MTLTHCVKCTSARVFNDFSLHWLIKMVKKLERTNDTSCSIYVPLILTTFKFSML